MIVTNKNNKYYFWICLRNEDPFKSEEYDSKIDCLQEFCKKMREFESSIWGQFICHHYADVWQEEKTEVIFTLNNED